MKKFGFLDRAESYLKEAGMTVKIIDGIESDPSVETVMNGAKVMLEFGPDWIVAIGGGSPIDAAKAMWIKYEYPDCTFEDMCKVFGIPELRKKAKFCAVSSTSGTATEVTAFSIITDYKKGIKYPIADFEITPDVAIVEMDSVEGRKGGKVFLTIYFRSCSLMMSHINSYKRKKLGNRSAYQLFSFLHDEGLLEKLGITLIPSKKINLTPLLLKK